MEYTPFIFPNVCEWSTSPMVEPSAPTKPQNTPYILPPYLPLQRVVCDPTGRYGCAVEANSLQNSELEQDGFFPELARGSYPYPSSYPYPGNVLPQLYTRGPAGPWQRVGYVVADNPDRHLGHGENVRDKTMPLFARKRNNNRSNTRYDYRVTDTNDVAIDVATNVQWLFSGEKVHVDGRSEVYTVKVYSEFQ